MLRDEAHFRSVIDVFRRAALGEMPWESAMSGLSEATRATSANLVGAHDGQLQFAWTNNLDPAMWDELGEAMNNAEMNPRLRVAGGARPFERIEGYDFGSDELTRRFPVYGEVCRKYDLGFGSLMNLEVTGSDFVGLGLLRGRRVGHGSAEDAAAMTALAPHLLDAVRLRRAIEDQGALIACGAMEHMKATAFLCNGWGRVVRMTSAAEQLVSREGGLALKKGILSCHSATANRLLLDAITSAARDAAPPTRTVVLVNPTGERITAEVSALPVPAGALDFAPRAIVTVRRRKTLAETGVIKAALDLTTAEAEVARLIAMGLPRAEIANRRNTSADTIRAQLKSIFAKLNVSREVELVIRINELS